MRPDKQACSDTVQVTISWTDEAVAQRKRAPSSCSIIHTMTDTSLHLHITTFHSHDSSSHRVMHHERGTVYWSVLHSLRLKTDDSHESGQLSLDLDTAGTLEFVSERRVTEQPDATHRRINEAGDSAPSSQDSVTRAVQNLHISDSLAAAAAALPAPPPSTMRNSRRPPRPKQQPREYLRCAQCGPDPAAYKAPTDGGLMHIEQKRGGQHLLSESVGQLRRLGRAACVVCGTSVHNDATVAASRSMNFVSGIPFRTRQPGHQNAAPGGTAADQQPPQNSQPVLQENHLTTARFRIAPFWTLSSQNETCGCSPSFAEPPG